MTNSSARESSKYAIMPIILSKRFSKKACARKQKTFQILLGQYFYRLKPLTMIFRRKAYILGGNLNTNYLFFSHQTGSRLVLPQTTTPHLHFTSELMCSIFFAFKMRPLFVCTAKDVTNNKASKNKTKR